MPDETWLPVLTVVVVVGLVLSAFIYMHYRDSEQKPPIQPATEGTIAPATETTCE